MNTKWGSGARIWGALAVAVGAVAGSWTAVAPGAPAKTIGTRYQPVSAAEDNPPGCKIATGEGDSQCGAQGRAHFDAATHIPPIDACARSVAPTGSVVDRLLIGGPRRADGSMAFIPGVCVYLPPGYATSGLRYPVMYLFHGGGGDESDWVQQGDIRGIMDRAYAADPKRAMIVVMPDGRSGQWFDYEDRSFLNLEYVLEAIVSDIESRYRTIVDRQGRAVVGLSNGGYGAMHFAGKRPDRFVTAGGMSSNLGARTMSGLGPDGAVYYQGNVPFQLAENYDGLDLILDIGTTCTSADPYCATIAVDTAFHPDHVAVEQRMNEIDHVGVFDLRNADGAHGWTWWKRWLEERQLPFVQARTADPTAGDGPVSRIPASFRYRSIAPTFFVWGYEVSVERSVREFLDLRSVGASGFEIQGSGKASVTTAAYYRPGGSYTIGGNVPGDGRTVIRADRDGRLTIPVDLGPSHTNEEFTDQADAAEATGNYWVVRKVTIADAGTGNPVNTSPPAVPRVDPPRRATSSATAGRSGPTGVGGVAESTAPAGEPVTSTIGPLTSTEQAVAEPTSASRTISDDDGGPQAVPTLLFLAAIGGGGYALYRRRAAAKAAS